MEDQGPYAVQAVVKAAAILDAFAEAAELSLSELAERTGIPKASVFRLASTLEGVGLLSRGSNGTYALGYKPVYYARLVLARGLPFVARPYLEELFQSFGHTVNLASLDGGQVLFVDVLESRRNLRMASGIGWREPLHATAVGKAILANLVPSEVDRIISQSTLNPLTPKTITSRARLAEELAQVRERGYATDTGELQAGAHCVGAAICDPRGVIGGISVSAPAQLLPEEDFGIVGTAVHDAAAKITAALGGDHKGLRLGRHETPAIGVAQ